MYFLNNHNPLLNRTSLPRGSVPTARYRASLESRTNVTEDLNALVDVTKLSDRFVLQDFFLAKFGHYSTCSIEAEENESVVERALEQFPFRRLSAEKSLLPFRDHVDGAFAAKLPRIA